MGFVNTGKFQIRGRNGVGYCVEMKGRVQVNDNMFLFIRVVMKIGFLFGKASEMLYLLFREG